MAASASKLVRTTTDKLTIKPRPPSEHCRTIAYVHDNKEEHEVKA